MRVPDATDLDAAWDALPPEEARRIGRIALDLVFYSFLAGDSYAEVDKVLKDHEARGAAENVSGRSLTDLYTVIEDALPDLFGPAGDNPAWSKESEGAPANG